MTDLSEYHWYIAIFRSIFAMLDKLIYNLVSGMYNIFLIVAGAEIRADIVTTIFNRIQLILGIIVLFKLVISFFSGIVNPDSLNDQKKGIGSIIKRVVVVLVMLLMIVPLNIPTRGDSSNQANSQLTWNERMNESGILFGTLSELQSRILNSNLISNLILGNYSDEYDEYINSVDSTNDMSEKTKTSIRYQAKSSDMALTLLKSFIYINMKPGYENMEKEEHWLCNAEDMENNFENLKWIASDYYIQSFYFKDNFVEAWNKFSQSIANDTGDENPIFNTKNGSIIYSTYYREQLLDHINDKCRPESEAWGNGERYVYVYHLLLSTIAGVLFLIMVLSLTIDVAVRVFKLFILRLISPVAILSYIDPASEKTFNNWVKALTTTYLDLFIRIAIISFTMLFISIIPKIEFNVPGGGIVYIFARVILFFGLLYFAKEAPKFINETLGIDSKEGKGLFSGLGKLKTGVQTALAPAVGVLGGISTAKTAYKASQLSDEVTDKNTKHSAKNKAKAIMSGIINGTGTTVSTAKTYGKSKDHKWRTAMDKVNSANAYRLQNAEEGGTWWGKTKEQIKQDFTGDSRYSQLKREEKDLKDKQQMFNSAAGLIKSLDSEVDNEVKKKGLQTMIKYKDSNGVVRGFRTNTKDIAAAWERGQNTGVYELNGHKFASAAEFSKIQADAIDFAKDTVYKGTAKFANGADYTAPSKIGSMQASVKAIFSSNDYAISYDNSKGMVANMKNAADYLNNQSYVKEQELSQKQKEIATAQANVRGTDGHPGGK